MGLGTRVQPFLTQIVQGLNLADEGNLNRELHQDDSKILHVTTDATRSPSMSPRNAQREGAIHTVTRALARKLLITEEHARELMRDVYMVEDRITGQDVANLHAFEETIGPEVVASHDAGHPWPDAMRLGSARYLAQQVENGGYTIEFLQQCTANDPALRAAVGGALIERATALDVYDPKESGTTPLNASWERIAHALFAISTETEIQSDVAGLPCAIKASLLGGLHQELQTAMRGYDAAKGAEDEAVWKGRISEALKRIEVLHALVELEVTATARRTFDTLAPLRDSLISTAEAMSVWREYDSDGRETVLKDLLLNSVQQLGYNPDEYSVMVGKLEGRAMAIFDYESKSFSFDATELAETSPWEIAAGVFHECTHLDQYEKMQKLATGQLSVGEQDFDYAYVMSIAAKNYIDDDKLEVEFGQDGHFSERLYMSQPPEVAAYVVEDMFRRQCVTAGLLASDSPTL